MFKYEFVYSEHFSIQINCMALQEELEESGLDCDGFHYHEEHDQILFIFPNDNSENPATVTSLVTLMDDHEDDPFYLRQAQAKKRQEIHDYLLELLEAGLPYSGSPLIEEKYFSCTDHARGAIGDIISSGKDYEEIYGADTYVSEWWSLDNVEYSFNLAEFKILRLTLGATLKAMYKQRRLHKNTMLALTTVSAVEAYDYTTGWPG